jgi:ribose transport system ATP-binding protein
VSAPILEVDQLSKTFPGQVALDGAHLEVQRGQIHALVGQNGSGKSTLIKCLAGYQRADHGALVRFDGEPVDLWHRGAALNERMRFVHQDLGLVPTLSAIENLGLGRGYLRGAGGRIRWRAEAERAQELLLRFGVAPDVRVPVGTLSTAERAAIAIVRALQDWDETRAGLLVLDEPTARLSRNEVSALFGEIRATAERGNGVLFVSHLLDEVLGLADVVTVLRDGRVVAAAVPVSELDQERLVSLIVGREIDELITRPESRRGAPALELIGVVGPTLRGVSLRVHHGEILGVAGLVGSGRDEICTAAFGATPRFAGRVLVHKRKVFASPRDAIRAGMALVPSDRPRQGLIAEDRLVHHLTLPRLGPLQRRGRIDHRLERREARSWVERLDIRPPMLGRKMAKFSGGNQQKAVLARWLRTEPSVLLLDEPTQGVDVGSKADIYREVADVAASGVAVLVASSDVEELVHLCHRVVVMRAGQVVCELEGASLDEARLTAETFGSTSLRGLTTLRRRPVRMKVITEDPAPVERSQQVVPEPPHPEPPRPAPSRWARLADRLGRWWRR